MWRTARQAGGRGENRMRISSEETLCELCTTIFESLPRSRKFSAGGALSIEHSTRQVLTTNWAMILRSPAENENGGLSFHRVPSSTRHSRTRGNPGLLRRISLDTRFRGYDGTQAGLVVLIPKRVFSKEVTKVSDILGSKLCVLCG